MIERKKTSSYIGREIPISSSNLYHFLMFISNSYPLAVRGKKEDQLIPNNHFISSKPHRNLKILSKHEDAVFRVFTKTCSNYPVVCLPSVSIVGGTGSFINNCFQYCCRKEGYCSNGNNSIRAVRMPATLAQCRAIQVSSVL